ncbi:uncharacterized protein isoform X2 [Musca autumnalis]|uniref:uncharacterized protein isoform X2 n=1 Tax=Musca autumnalis TaxID=221902 RepID=UPI003CF78B9E
MLAKLACGLNKPNKQTILPITHIHQLFGAKFGEEVCQQLGIRYVGEIQKFKEAELQRKFDEKSGQKTRNTTKGSNATAETKKKSRSLWRMVMGAKPSPQPRPHTQEAIIAIAIDAAITEDVATDATDGEESAKINTKPPIKPMPNIKPMMMLINIKPMMMLINIKPMMMLINIKPMMMLINIKPMMMLINIKPMMMKWTTMRRRMKELFTCELSHFINFKNIRYFSHF